MADRDRPHFDRQRAVTTDSDLHPLTEELSEAWWTNQRILLHLIDETPEEGMRCTLSKRGGRDVARQFGHLHDVRVWQLEKRAKALSEGLSTFPSKCSPSKEELREALEASAARIDTFLRDVLNGVPKRRGFKKGIFTTLSYFVAHESHHRGTILTTLKEKGHLPHKNARYAIWDWDRR